MLILSVANVFVVNFEQSVSFTCLLKQRTHHTAKTFFTLDKSLERFKLELDRRWWRSFWVVSRIRSGFLAEFERCELRQAVLSIDQDQRQITGEEQIAQNTRAMIQMKLEANRLGRRIEARRPRNYPVQPLQRITPSRFQIR
ncbi:MAG: hypothetical protein AAFY56_05155 [Pseudomonadota bacterium]